MPGEKNLKQLLQTLNPELDPRLYVFCTIDSSSIDKLRKITTIATFQEKEGLSLTLTKLEADKHGLSYEGEFKLISFNVHSSLDAVGMTAAISKKLTEKNISANIIAAYHHDHIFISQVDAERALLALAEFSDA
ncbi:MAG: ACT domain-containing protein [Pseudomonadales bacterium]|nr:ACT domain-containing protein [Pseudomonadales bacterium]